VRAAKGVSVGGRTGVWDRDARYPRRFGEPSMVNLPKELDMECDVLVKRMIESLSAGMSIDEAKLEAVYDKAWVFESDFVPATVAGTSGMDNERLITALDLRWRLKLLALMGVDPKETLKNLLSGGRGTARCNWAWRPTEELEAILGAWIQANELHMLRHNPVAILKIGCRVRHGTQAENIESNLAALKAIRSMREVGLNDADIMKIMHQQPAALCYGEDFKDMVERLSQILHCDESRALRAVRRWSGVVRITEDTARRKSAIFEEMGLEPKDCRSIFCRCPSLLGNTDKKTRERFVALLQQGMTKQEVAILAYECPTVLTLDVTGDNFRQKMFFLQQIGVAPGDVARKPVLLTYALKTRLYPRGRLLQLILGQPDNPLATAVREEKRTLHGLAHSLCIVPATQLKELARLCNMEAEDCARLLARYVEEDFPLFERQFEDMYQSTDPSVNCWAGEPPRATAEWDRYQDAVWGQICTMGWDDTLARSAGSAGTSEFPRWEVTETRTTDGESPQGINRRKWGGGGGGGSDAMIVVRGRGSQLPPVESQPGGQTREEAVVRFVDGKEEGNA